MRAPRGARAGTPPVCHPRAARVRIFLDEREHTALTHRIKSPCVITELRCDDDTADRETTNNATSEKVDKQMVSYGRSKDHVSNNPIDRNVPATRAHGAIRQTHRAIRSAALSSGSGGKPEHPGGKESEDPHDAGSSASQSPGNRKCHRVKMFHAHKGYGFLDADGKDEFVHISNVIDGTTPQPGDSYWYEVIVRNDGRSMAINMAMTLEASLAASPRGSHHRFRQNSHLLTDWAYMPNLKPHNTSKTIHGLANRILEEDWHRQVDKFEDVDTFGGLRNYLFHTFTRLSNEGNIMEGGDYATFNTGLVTRSYDPVFALFERNNHHTPKWKWKSFCEVNKGNDGRILIQAFRILPPAASYFEKLGDLLFDGNAPIDYNLHHVTLDGIRNDRYPPAFLARHVPGFSIETYESFTERQGCAAYLGEAADGLEGDEDAFREFRKQLNRAMALSKKRARQNYRLAVPQYYPEHNQVGFLMPVALVNENKVDAAIVMNSRAGKQGLEYYARTIYPLSYAYLSARLVGKPVGDWLSGDA